MTNRGIVPIIFVLILILATGGFIHAVMPHQHSHNSEITDLMHAAIRIENKEIYIIPIMEVFSILILASASAVVVRWLLLLSLTVRACTAEAILLRNGVAPHRKFR